MRELIFTIFILVLISGCSENPNPVNSDATLSEIKTSVSPNIKSYKNLIWKHDGISVEANGERFVYSEVYCDLRQITRSKLFVTFDGWTNADTTSYISDVLIESDGQTLFTESGELYINRHHEFLLENTGYSNLRFYIRLWCDEVECNSSAALRVFKIKIYKQ